LLWQNSAAVDLGNLGGKLFTNAYGVSGNGMVVGASDLPGDTNYYLQPGAFSTAHAFRWNSGVMTDLGALPGDVQSSPNAINDRGQAVGCGSRAILWQDVEIIDLNTLVPGPPFSPLYLLCAYDINDRGEIVGQGLTGNGDVHAFLAVPCDADHADAPGCRSSSADDANLEANQPVLANDMVDASQRSLPRVWRPLGNPAWLRMGAIPGHHFSSPTISNGSAPASARTK
jgi:probable HAF family extracellular repeat protein